MLVSRPGLGLETSRDRFLIILVSVSVSSMPVSVLVSVSDLPVLVSVSVSDLAVSVLVSVSSTKTGMIPISIFNAIMDLSLTSLNGHCDESKELTYLLYCCNAVVFLTYFCFSSTQSPET
jgi:threonine/homoserine efflux transporter RhtA